MNTLKNIAKKAVAVGSGAVMLGATIGGALALDLADYPAPFIKNGQFDGLIVVGEKAATSDVIGSIDIASSLQRAATTAVDGGSGTETVVSGDNVKIGDSSDMLEIGEYLGDVTESLTSSDLELLKSGTVTTDKGTTDYTQTLDLAVNNTPTNGRVILDENNDDETGVYLFFEDSDNLFTYDLEFTSGLESDVVSNALDDLEDEEMFMLGSYYSVADTTTANLGGASPDLTLELISGNLVDTLEEGQTKTYTVDGKKYEVTALIISDNAQTVKFLVNGETSDSLGDGDTDTLSDGLEIGVREVIPNEGTEANGGDLVEFYLGANKLELVDTDFDSAGGGTVEINRERIEDATLEIDGTDSGGTTEVRINSISITLAADSADGTDLYLAKGEGVRAMLDEPEGMLADWDIVFQGLSTPSTSDINFKAAGDDQYELTFTNRRGSEYTVPFLYAGDSTDDNGVFGDEDDTLVVWEVDAGDDDAFSAAGDYNIDLDDYFVITGTSAGTADNNDDTYVLRFNDVDESDSTVSFEDVASGQDVTDTFTGTASAAAGTPASGTLTVGGKDYSYSFYEPTAGDYRLSVDLDHDADFVNNAVVEIVSKGGGILLPTAAADPTDPMQAGPNVVTLTTLAEDMDTFAGNLAVSITFTETTDEVDVDIPGTDVIGQYYANTDSDADVEYALTAYGTWFEKTDDSDSSDDLDIMYPSEQVEAMVFVVGADAKATTTASGGATRVNPIAVGSAVLDSDVVFDQDNMIVVGGPCVNTMAAQLLGNPADCAEGFTMGRAMLKLFDTGSNTAVLVAGYSAQDTQGASRVLAEYADYKLSGMEADVVVTSLTNIKVQ